MELEILKTAISNILKVDPNEITEDTTFLGDLGADSLDVYQIVNGVEEELNITIAAEDVENITTVKEAVEVIIKAENHQ
ncbi:MAG: acyl carrier protein [Lachnospiraceae bacterium]|nr:acyl carrier protein [Lachnospiraceae bacterium]